MRCPFCNQPCILRQDEPAFKEAYWRCHTHRDLSVWIIEKYNEDSAPEMIRYSIDMFINDKEYRITVDVLNNTTRIYQVLYDHEMSYSWLEEMKNIKFTHAMNITPENAKEKLKLYLTFL